MLIDHSRQAAQEAEEIRWRRQAQQALGDFIDDLDYWDWMGTTTFRHPVASERAFALVKNWLSRLEKAAGGRITAAMAVSRGESGGRVHIHFLVAGVDNLDMKEWETNAIRLFGDCKIEEFDPEKGGCHYFAKNALSEHGDYRLVGKAVEDRVAAEQEDELAEYGEHRLGDKAIDDRIAAEEDNTEIVPPNPQLKAAIDNPKRQPPSKQSIRPVTAKRAAVYVRTGCETDAEDLILHQRIQLRPIDRLIAERGWNRPTVYRDVASAKAGKRRRGLEALTAAAQNGDVDVIVVSRLDRIARNMREISTFLAELHKLGVDFVSLDDGLDTTHRRGRALFTVATTLVKMERGLRSERSEAGLENARRHGTKTGNPIGRPPAVVDMERILKFKDKGWGFGRIARKVGVSKSTVYRRYKECDDAH